MMLFMPSPIGHVLAGMAVALVADTLSPSLRSPVGFKTGVVTLAGLAALPDLDLLYPPMHRAFSHSVGCVVLVTIMGGVVRVGHRPPGTRIRRAVWCRVGVASSARLARHR